MNNPLMIIHGLFGMSDNWQTLGQKFSHNRPVYLVDLRNHGKSFHSDEMNLQIMAQDIIEVINHYHLKDVFLLGHSLGGKVAMETAIHSPELITKLIVADIAPKSYPPHHQIYFNAMKSIDFQIINSRKEVENQLNDMIKSSAIVQFLLKNVYKKENGQYGFKFNLEVLDRYYNDLIVDYSINGKYNHPVLFIYGGKSNYVTIEEDESLIKNIFPKAEFKEIKEAGHWLHAEKPNEFYDAIEIFINSR